MPPHLALRVGQLDCDVLDEEIVSQLWRRFEIVRDSLPTAFRGVVRILNRVEPEIKFALRSVTLLVPLLESGWFFYYTAGSTVKENIFCGHGESVRLQKVLVEKEFSRG